MKPFLSFLSALVAAALVWTHANPLYVAFAVSSGVSLAYDRLAKYPRVHAAFQILAGLGFDVPKIADGFSRVLTGKTVEEAKLATVKTAVAALGVAAMLLLGCGATLPTVGKDTVDSVEAAWLLSASACLASADPTVKTKCANVLLPARQALLAAALDVDNGGKDYVCELIQAGAALAFAGTLVTLPAAVKDAVTLVGTLKCQTDAGTALVVPPSPVVVLDGGAQ